MVERMALARPSRRVSRIVLIVGLLHCVTRHTLRRTLPELNLIIMSGSGSRWEARSFTVHPSYFSTSPPRVSIRNYRVRIDGCVGESFIRSYAILSSSTDERETILSWYGATKAV